MTTAEATEVTAFIAHPALRAMAAESLIAGRTFICPDCGQIASAETGCAPCDDVMFASLCAEHDALTENAHDPYEVALERAMAGRADVYGASRYGDL